jgi:GTP-binding protein YchF
MRTGIIGLLQSGKTSLFKMLTHAHTAVGFGGHETHLGVAKVPDRRLDRLIELYQPKKHVYASIEYLDVPALSKEHLREATYLANLREVDALAHVVRLFAQDADAMRDVAAVEEELILSDLVQVEKRLERLERDLKKQKTSDLEHEHQVLTLARSKLENTRPLRELELDANDKKRIRGFQFLSEKPMLLVLNAAEDRAANLHELETEYRDQLGDRANTAVVAVCGSIEAELADLPDSEAAEFMASYGLQESGLERLVRATYALLGLISFFTVGENEVHAWTVPRNATALEAAGAIHTDLARHFIRAEVVACEDLLRVGSLAAARDAGVLRLEGKEAHVKDGEIVHIRHSG